METMENIKNALILKLEYENCKKFIDENPDEYLKNSREYDFEMDRLQYEYMRLTGEELENKIRVINP